MNSTQSQETLSARTAKHNSNGFEQGEIEPIRDAIDYLKAYARERPDVAALWCLGVGFILGWKLKPW